MKNKYDSSVVFLYAIGKEELMPHEFRKKIPYSTISDWRKTVSADFVWRPVRWLIRA